MLFELLAAATPGDNPETPAAATKNSPCGTSVSGLQLLRIEAQNLYLHWLGTIIQNRLNEDKSIQRRCGRSAIFCNQKPILPGDEKALAALLLDPPAGADPKLQHA